MRCQKQKDFEEFEAIPFRLETVGDSCVVVPASPAAPRSASKAAKLPTRQAAVLEALQRATEGLTVPLIEQATKVPHSTVYDALEALKGKGLVEEIGGKVYVAVGPVSTVQGSYIDPPADRQTDNPKNRLPTNADRHADNGAQTELADDWEEELSELEADMVGDELSE